MFSIFLAVHSFFRWLVIGSLVLSVVVAINGIRKRSVFKPWHNSLRHVTATIAHIQLMTGIFLYTQSPQVKYYFSKDAQGFGEAGFFSVIHFSMMIIAIVLVTLGSAFAKRKPRPHDKYRTMLWWFAAALLLILLAIPWPFSPLAQRPVTRTF